MKWERGREWHHCFGWAGCQQGIVIMILNVDFNWPRGRVIWVACHTSKMLPNRFWSLCRHVISPSLLLFFSLAAINWGRYIKIFLTSCVCVSLCLCEREYVSWDCGSIQHKGQRLTAEQKKRKPENNGSFYRYCNPPSIVNDNTNVVLDLFYS